MKFGISTIPLLFLSITVFSQQRSPEHRPSGKVHAKVFWNYHADFSEGTSQRSAFQLTRSYFGYTYKFSPNMAAKITFDVGGNDAGSAYTSLLKIAQLDWKVAPSITLNMGLIGMKQFNDQEKNWGYRYLFKSFQDENKLGASADLGVNAAIALSNKLTANLFMTNGEGYKNLQDEDGKQRFGASLVCKPLEGITTKIYVDSHAAAGSKAMTNLAFFAGYQSSIWRLGAEYNLLANGKNYQRAENDHNLEGWSLYTSVRIGKKCTVFGRFDQLSSNTISGASAAWNIDKDGNQVIAGLQYAPAKGLKLALNYQGFDADDSAANNRSQVFLNAEFKL